MVGENIEGNEEVIKRMYEEGHLIGNHTYRYVQLDTLNVNMARSEIIQTNEKITEVTSKCPKYICPSFGAYSDKLLSEIIDILQNQGYVFVTANQILLDSC